MAPQPTPAHGVNGEQPSRLSRFARRFDAMPIAWRVFLHPALIIATALLLTALIIPAMVLPQLPDQIRGEPAATARWLVTAVNETGSGGPLFRSLGLFDVLHSPLFRLTLALLTLVAALHLADAVGAALGYHRMTRRYCSTPINHDGLAVETAARPLYQRRFAVPAPPQEVRARALESMKSLFDTVEDCPNQAQLELQPHPPASDPLHTIVSPDFQILALRMTLSFLLQPLAALGMLCALAVLWLYLLAGWQVTSPILAPGEAYRAPSQRLLVEYQALGGLPGTEAPPHVAVQIDTQPMTTSVTSDSDVRSGAIDVSGRPSSPGLLIRVVDGRPILQEPGQSEQTANAGVILPSPGSEDSVLIPGASLGLRVVRRTDDTDALFVEAYQGADIRPMQRIDVTGPTRVSVDGDTQLIDLEFLPLPGMEVTVRYMPGYWLLWAAAGLLVAGLVGLLRRPAFAVTSISQWLDERSVVVLQASRADDIDKIRAALQPAGANASPDNDG